MLTVTVSADTRKILSRMLVRGRYIDHLVQFQRRLWLESLDRLQKQLWGAADLHAARYLLRELSDQSSAGQVSAILSRDWSRAVIEFGCDVRDWRARAAKVKRDPLTAKALLIVVAESWSGNPEVVEAIERGDTDT